MKMLLPDQLQALWQAVGERRLTAEEFTRKQDGLLAEYRAMCTVDKLGSRRLT